MVALAPGTACDVARAAGAILIGKGPKYTCLCILHEDRTASAFVSFTNNTYGCSVCLPGTAITAKELALRKGLDWPSFLRSQYSLPQPRIQAETSFTEDDAALVWQATRARMLDDESAASDADVYEYVHKRGLGEAIEMRSFGILAPGNAPHPALAKWASSGHRLVAPLYDRTGRVACVQARNIRGLEPKTLAPKGSRMAGTVFANQAGLALLRGEPRDHDTVILGEGLTDYLALSIATTIPVFAAPGTSTAVKAVGSWVHGLTLMIALDVDEAGQMAARAVGVTAFELGARRIRTVLWPDHANDACDFVAKRGVDGLAQYLKSKLTGGTK